MHREPLDPNHTHSPDLILFNRRELATLNAMLRIVDDLIWYRYPGANQLFRALADLRETCAAHLTEDDHATPTQA